jgi:alcohol dehydrogenase class IV
MSTQPPALSHFQAATRVVIAPGRAAAALAVELPRVACARWCVVADRGLAENGGLDRLLRALPRDAAPVLELVGEDPDAETIGRLVAQARDRGSDAVIAIGGGSGLCAGKAVAIGLANPGPLAPHAGHDRLERPPAPCLAIPTTAGSGSEVSEVVILHQADGGPHLMIRGRGYAPRVAILDGEVMRTLPTRPMLLAALDALAHAYEALWSRGADRFTDAFAFSAARQLREALPPALDGDAAARQQLIEASAMANYACGNSELATVHAMSSAPEVHLPHGYQTGVLLPHVARRIADVLPAAVQAEIEALEPLYAKVGFVSRFAPGELDEAGLEAVARAGIENPLSSNDPRPPTFEELRTLLREAGAGDR